MEQLFERIAAHLRPQGFAATIEHGILKVAFPNVWYFWVLPAHGGALFRTLFKPNAEAVDAAGLFLTFVNRLNAEGTLTRFTWSGDFLIAESWFPNLFEATVFQSFFSVYAQDIGRVTTIDPPAFQRFFTLQPTVG